MSWISAEDRRHFEREGYLVARGVLPQELVRQAREEIAAAVGADLRDPESWYRGAPSNGGIVPLHHLQCLWNIRQHPKVYAAFSDYWGGMRKLYTDMNRCCFRPPQHPDHPGFGEPEIHWDVDPRLGFKGWIQGMVLLTDVGPNGGGFQCIPEIYRGLEDWLARRARSKRWSFLKPGLDRHPTVQVSGKAGDLVIWSTRLPHGPAPNLSSAVRVAAFVTLSPSRKHPSMRAELTELVREKRAPNAWQGLANQPESEGGDPVRLTPLGECIAGIRPWPEDGRAPS